MVMRYTEFDLNAIKSFTIRFKSVPIPQYAEIAGDILFQFPPKVPSDNKTGNWNDTQTLFDEPVAVYTTIGPRDITMNLTYIVTDASSPKDFSYTNSVLQGGGDPNYYRNNDPWTAEKIHQQLRRLRGYFNASRTRGGIPQANQRFQDSLVLIIKLAGIGGTSEMTGRMTNVNVNYSETLVSSNVASNNLFPLRTDVSIGLRLWTRNAEEKTSEGIQNVPGLSNNVKVDWY